MVRRGRAIQRGPYCRSQSYAGRYTLQAAASGAVLILSNKELVHCPAGGDIERLPLNGRNALHLVALLPGVVNAGTGEQMGATQVTFITFQKKRPSPAPAVRSDSLLRHDAAPLKHVVRNRTRPAGGRCVMLSGRWIRNASAWRLMNQPWLAARL